MSLINADKYSEYGILPKVKNDEVRPEVDKYKVEVS